MTNQFPSHSGIYSIRGFHTIKKAEIDSQEVDHRAVAIVPTFCYEVSHPDLMEVVFTCSWMENTYVTTEMKEVERRK